MALLVIGYGNPLRRDDGFGGVVARQVAAGRAGRRTVALACHQLTPELAEPIGGADLVVFVDACQGPCPGRVSWQPVEPAPPGAPFSHALDPAALLAWARDLFGGCPGGLLVSVDAADLGYGEGLSPAVEAAVPEVVERICRLAEAEAVSSLPD